MISSVTEGSYLTIQVLTFLYVARDVCMSPNPGVRIQGITFLHKGGILAQRLVCAQSAARFPLQPTGSRTASLRAQRMVGGHKPEGAGFTGHQRPLCHTY